MSVAFWLIPTHLNCASCVRVWYDVHDITAQLLAFNETIDHTILYCKLSQAFG